MSGTTRECAPLSHTRFSVRSYPTPILRPLWPFMVAAGITFYGVNTIQEKLTSTPEAKKDPKNPYGEVVTRKDSI